MCRTPVTLGGGIMMRKGLGPVVRVCPCFERACGLPKLVKAGFGFLASNVLSIGIIVVLAVSAAQITCRWREGKSKVGFNPIYAVKSGSR